MRPAGRLKLGFYPWPLKDADRIRGRFHYPDEFAALQLNYILGKPVPFPQVLGYEVLETVRAQM
jgi:hypothetical protein